MSSQEVPGVGEGGDAADAVAEVLAWGRRLVELGRLDDARQVLLDALDGAADPVPMTMALAWLEYDAGAAGRAAEFLRKVLVDRPGNTEAAQGLAQVLLDGGNLDEAARVLGDAEASGAPGASRSGSFAELAGEIFLRQGRHAEALAAFGSPRLLTSRGRGLRRRAWWRPAGHYVAIAPPGAPPALADHRQWLGLRARHPVEQRQIHPMRCSRRWPGQNHGALMSAWTTPAGCLATPSWRTAAIRHC